MHDIGLMQIYVLVINPNTQFIEIQNTYIPHDISVTLFT